MLLHKSTYSLVWLVTPLLLLLYVYPTHPEVAQCPHQCSCQNVQEKGVTRMLVECSDRNLTSLPHLYGLEDVEQLVVELKANRNKIRYLLKSSLLSVAGRLAVLEIGENGHRLDISRGALESFAGSLVALTLDPLPDDLNDKVKSFTSLTKLTKLSLSTRSGEDIEQVLRTPIFPTHTQPALVHLHLTRCSLVDIQEPALRQMKLISLTLSYNKFRRFPAALPAMISTTLSHLYMDHNQVSELMFADIPAGCKLHILDLSFNELSYIDDGMLDHCRALEIINISHNPYLLKIDPSVFTGLTNLILDVSNTNIRRLDFISPAQVKELRVEDSNMACTCELQVKERPQFGNKLRGTCRRIVGVDFTPVVFDISKINFDCKNYFTKQIRRREEGQPAQSTPETLAPAEPGYSNKYSFTDASPLGSSPSNMLENQQQQWLYQQQQQQHYEAHHHYKRHHSDLPDTDNNVPPPEPEYNIQNTDYEFYLSPHPPGSRDPATRGQMSLSVSAEETLSRFSELPSVQRHVLSSHPKSSSHSNIEDTSGPHDQTMPNPSYLFASGKNKDRSSLLSLRKQGQVSGDHFPSGSVPERATLSTVTHQKQPDTFLRSEKVTMGSGINTLDSPSDHVTTGQTFHPTTSTPNLLHPPWKVEDFEKTAAETQRSHLHYHGNGEISESADNMDTQYLKSYKSFLDFVHNQKIIDRKSYKQSWPHHQVNVGRKQSRGAEGPQFQSHQKPLEATGHHTPSKQPTKESSSSGGSTRSGSTGSGSTGSGSTGSGPVKKQYLGVSSWYLRSPLSVLACVIHALLTLLTFLSVDHGRKFR